MPNWCSTRIIIATDNVNKLKQFDELLTKWTSYNYSENGFGLSWLGNVVGNSGIGTVDTGTNTDLRCRGYIVNTDLYDNELHIDTETAWEPFLKMWRLLVDKCLPDASILYHAEECGMQIYATNDEDLVGRYVVDPYDIDLEYSFDASEGYVIELLQKLLNTQIDDIDKLLDMFEDSEELTEKLGINKWKYEGIDIWD